MAAAAFLTPILARWKDDQLSVVGITTTSTVLIISIVICYLWWTTVVKTSRGPPLPPGPMGFPIVGHIPFLLGDPFHRKLTGMAAQYGPIFQIRIGSQLHVVVSSAALAKQVLNTKEAAFSRRDLPLAIPICTYGGLDLGCQPMGHDWTSMRKVLVREVVSGPSLDRCYPLMRREVVRLLGEVSEREIGRPVDVHELVYKMVGNATMAMTWGGEDGDVDYDLARELGKGMMEVMGKGNVSDAFPLLARFDLQGIQGKAAELTQRFDRLMSSMIEKRLSGGGGGNNRGGEKKIKDFLQVLLEVRERSGPTSSLASMTNFKALILDITPGGTENISSTIKWTMAELLNCDKAMKMVKQELDDVVGLNSLVENHHLRDLKYLDAVIKEVCRLHLLLIQRVATQPCTVGGYSIPEGTKVIVNAWAIHRDPQVWGDEPLEFRPERFLENGRFDFAGNRNGEMLYYFPFGSGRRICAGVNLAGRLFKYVLASLLHTFEWKLPDGEELVDLSDEFTLLINMKNPLIAVPTPRLATPDLLA